MVEVADPGEAAESVSSLSSTGSRVVEVAGVSPEASVVWPASVMMVEVIEVARRVVVETALEDVASAPVEEVVVEDSETVVEVV